jgi:hypothetical protein
MTQHLLLQQIRKNLHLKTPLKMNQMFLGKFIGGKERKIKNDYTSKFEWS